MIRFLWLGLLVLVLDQASKLWILASFDEYEVLRIWPVFNLTLVYNEGAAFSFLAEAGGWQQYLFIGLSSLVSLAVVIWMWRLQAHERLTAWALAVLLGGALGNLVDRVVHGKVVDFLQWHWGDAYFPSFNLADSAITLAVVLLLIDALRQQRAGASENSDKV